MTREYIFNEAAPALYDGGWRSTDRDDLVREHDLTGDEADMMCEALRELEQENTWYAVEMDENDNDWGTGSHDREEAIRMGLEMGAAKVAVIREGNDPECIGEIDLSKIAMLPFFEERCLTGDLNESFVCFLLERDIKPHEWDYGNLRDFAEAMGYEVI